MQQNQLNPRIEQIGQDLFKRAEKATGPSLFSKDWFYGNVMDWSMKNESFKTQMFRFVDVLPSLQSSSDVAQHLKEYFAEKGGELPGVFGFGLGVGALAPGLMAGAVRKNVQAMAKLFIAGENPAEAIAVLKRARGKNIGFTVDILGEATLSAAEALEYQRLYLDLIEKLAADSTSWEPNSILDSDAMGPIPRVNVSVKLSSIYSQINPGAWDESKTKLKERLRPIFTLAMAKNVFINVDMESYNLKDLTLEVFRDLVLEPAFSRYPHFGIVIQAYLRDSYADCEKLVNLANSRPAPLSVRLVKGAYWDYETIHARQKNWPIPVYTNKSESDANYERCASLLLNAYPKLKLCLGSHNIRSISAAMAVAESMGLAKNSFEVQMLYGMADSFKTAIVDMGYRLREYAPVGELIPGMAYLVRRLLENTSNESFLRSKFADNIDTRTLLRDPAEDLKVSTPGPEKSDRFENLAPLDFTQFEVRQKFEAALKKVEKQLGLRVDPFISGKTVMAEKSFERLSPADGKTVVGKIGVTDRAQADQAVAEALKAFALWKNTDVSVRAACVEKLADLIAADREVQAAWQVYEVGKQWAEADGDVAEAVDFCRYYARHMRELAKPKRAGHAPGEHSEYIYQPRGVALVIAPWNFPLAILTGMVAAAAVAGNTVIMKPAEQSSVVAAKLMDLIRNAGFPSGVIQFLPGYGEEIGDHLVHHKDIALIAFTGSKPVGLHILQAASQLVPGQKHLKRCIIELGGKNAVIVDSDADLDEAVQGVIYSAFGFQGQKCSACSRVIVLESVYDRFLARLVAAAKSLDTGPALNPKNILGPVVDSESRDRILSTIDAARNQCQVAYEGERNHTGNWVPPVIFAGVSPSHKIAQEEIFGPVVAVIKVKDIDEALRVANDIEFALTGGLYSRSPQNIAKVKLAFEAGNLYINRGITGAMVDRHPFGGFKLSGAGSKTGGPDYLLQFLEPKVVTENTMRRGFAPKED